MGSTVSRAQEGLSNCDDHHLTVSSKLQTETEQDCLRFYLPVESMSQNVKEQLVAGGFVNEKGEALLLKEKTIQYLRKGLSQDLGPSYVSLDASRPWLIYWMLHALELLGAYPKDLEKNIIASLACCLTKDKKGFGGGFMQFGHTAPTYAAVLAICTLDSEAAYDVIDRQAMYDFFMELKDPDGGFRVQTDGEKDTRGLYTVLAVASILNILTPELTQNCAEFVGQCQTFEGGMGGEPGNEAHGGYAYCALAALCILDRFDTINVDAFVEWVVSKQMRMEGGFQGRSNKLVDACYSFWQGATPVLLKKYLGIQCPKLSEEFVQTAAKNNFEDDIDEGSYLMAQTRLQQYLVLCCQFPEGGMRDKPAKHRDQYHTCYALSGLAVSQENGKVVWGAPSNQLQQTDPVYNVQVDKLKRAMDYFKSKPPVKTVKC